MELTLNCYPVSEMHFGDSTRLNGTSLEVNADELRDLLLANGSLQSVDLEIVRPGENCRAGPVFDIIEPRAKKSKTDIMDPMWAELRSDVADPE